jgi:hypothetical protein
VVPENSIRIEIRKLIGLGFSAMCVMLLSLLRSFRVYLQSCADPQTEILALRHQIVVLQLIKREVDDRLWTTEHAQKAKEEKSID